MTTTPRRPQGVTLACIFAGISSLLLLGNMVSLLSDWGSLSLQKQINTVLSQEPIASLDLSMSDALMWLRWVSMVVVVLSIAGVVLAIYTARGHRQSRVALSVLCVLAGLMFVSAGLGGLLPGAFSLACAVMLWSRDARAWFSPDKVAIEDNDSSVAAPQQSVATQPVATQPVLRENLPFVVAQQGGSGPVRRPAEVLISALTMLIGSALVFAVAGMNALMYLVAKNDYVQIIRDNKFMARSVADLNLTPEDFARWLFIGCISLATLALFGILGGAALFLRRPAVRIIGMVLAILTLIVSVLGFPVSLPWSAASITVIVLLNRRSSKDWYGSRHDGA